MKYAKLFLICLITTAMMSTALAFDVRADRSGNTTAEDSIRLESLNRYWDALSQTVAQGDFDGYLALYHPDAVVIFASGAEKHSMPIADAMALWREGFENTKNGKTKDQVSFRFSQRIGDETTAHETGIFNFVSKDLQGNILGQYVVAFEALLIKKNNTWLALMEYQKSALTIQDWEAIK